VQSAIRAITLDSLDLDYDDREALLDDLFLGFDLDDGDYDRDAAGLVADLFDRLGLAAGAPEGEPDDDAPADPAAGRPRTLALAREYLDALVPSADAEADPSVPSPRPRDRRTDPGRAFGLSPLHPQSSVANPTRSAMLPHVHGRMGRVQRNPSLTAPDDWFRCALPSYDSGLPP
jgi:hypothetical protein